MRYCQIWFRKETNLSYKLRAIGYFGSNKYKKEFSSFQNLHKTKTNLVKKVLVLTFSTSMGITSLVYLQKFFLILID